MKINFIVVSLLLLKTEMLHYIPNNFFFNSGLLRTHFEIFCVDWFPFTKSSPFMIQLNQMPALILIDGTNISLKKNNNL